MHAMEEYRVFIFILGHGDAGRGHWARAATIRRVIQMPNALDQSRRFQPRHVCRCAVRAIAPLEHWMRGYLELTP